MTEYNWPTPQEWAEELRTTDKVQCRITLRDGNSFCCLGILTDMALEESHWLAEERTAVYCSEAGGPAWMDQTTATRAFELNDSEGKSFAEIADWVDAGMPVE